MYYWITTDTLAFSLEGADEEDLEVVQDRGHGVVFVGAVGQKDLYDERPAAARWRNSSSSLTL
jgi:hypothetical protein